MKKIIVFLITFFLTSQYGNCSLSGTEINVFNLKENNMYIIEMPNSVKNIDISDKKIVHIIPVTTLLNEKNQLFIEANKSGVCDVLLTTASGIYQLRFITGPVFQDNKPDLIQIDIPSDYKYGIKSYD